jgi:hypothetical protein
MKRKGLLRFLEKKIMYPMEVACELIVSNIQSNQTGCIRNEKDMSPDKEFPEKLT